jgi:transcriptional regulator with XRE-family HTH domain
MAHCLPSRLKQLRWAQNIRQRDLEIALNLRPGAISQYERGLREPGIDMLLAIADYFEVSVDDLLGRRQRSVRVGG